MTLYISEAVAIVDDVTGDAKLASVAMDVYDAYVGGSLVTDLQDADGASISKATPDEDSGYQSVFQSASHTGTLFIEDPAGKRHPVFPADLGDRVGGVTSVTVDDGDPASGDVEITMPTWDDLGGMPAVVAAGEDEAAARAAISAVGTGDKNQPDGVAGLDEDGKLDPDVFSASIDLSGFLTEEDLGVKIDAIAGGDDSNLSAALASVASDKGVNGFIAVKVAGS